METIAELLAERLPKIRAALQAKGAASPSAGRSREAWTHGRFVVKLPLTEDGLFDNLRERRFFRADRDGILARCRILHVLDLPLLVMERLLPAPREGQPAWVDQVDSRQVGLDGKGRFKAYDYA